MAKSIHRYKLKDPEEQEYFHETEEAIRFLKEKGKRNPKVYDDGKVCFHHKGSYYFLTTYSFRWCVREFSNSKWNTADSLLEAFNAIDANAEKYYNKRR
jgi:hypothetical protein